MRTLPAVGTHIWSHLDFLQNLRKFWWFHPIFTNFGDIFVDKFVESPNFSLYFGNNFVPNLVTFYEPKNVTHFGDFFLDYYCESLKISPKLVIDFSPILVTLFYHKIFTNFGDFFWTILLNHQNFHFILRIILFQI